MNTLARTLTGSVIIIFSIWFILSMGFIGSSGINYSVLIYGLFFLAIGVAIFFNKNEDKIEEIKKDK